MAEKSMDAAPKLMDSRLEPLKTSEQKLPAPVQSGWIRAIQDATPAFIINHSTQIISALRTGADITSVKNGLSIKSPERIASGSLSVGSGMLGMYFKDQPRDNALEDAYKNMSLPSYIGTRICEGIFEPHKHITQTIGVVTLATTTLSLCSGLRKPLSASHKVDKGFVTDPKLLWEDFVKLPTYIKNIMTEGFNGYKPQGNMYGPMELINAPLGFAAGGVLAFAPHEEDGWKGYSSLMLARGITKIPTSIYASTHYNKIQGPLTLWQTYERYDPVIGVGLHQTANLVGLAYGGVRKLPDGTIVRIDQLNDIKNEQNQPAAPAIPDSTIVAADAKTDRLTPALEKIVTP